MNMLMHNKLYLLTTALSHLQRYSELEEISSSLSHGFWRNEEAC